MMLLSFTSLQSAHNASCSAAENQAQQKRFIAAEGLLAAAMQTKAAAHIEQHSMMAYCNLKHLAGGEGSGKQQNG
jgi:hypothetical protein